MQDLVAQLEKNFVESLVVNMEDLVASIAQNFLAIKAPNVKSLVYVVVLPTAQSQVLTLVIHAYFVLNLSLVAVDQGVEPQVVNLPKYWLLAIDQAAESEQRPKGFLRKDPPMALEDANYALRHELKVGQRLEMDSAVDSLQ